MAYDPFLKKRARIALLSGYGVATFLSFPHPVGERVIDLGVVCGWLSPAFLILALRGCSPRSAAKLAFVAAMVAHTAILHWFYIVSVVYGHVHPALGLLAPLGAGAHAGLFAALFAATLAWLGGCARSGDSGTCQRSRIPTPECSAVICLAH